MQLGTTTNIMSKSKRKSFMELTIICIYNNNDVYSKYLLASVKRQKQIDYELLAIDNTSNKYSSAAQALNQIIKNAVGDYLIIAHQDVYIYSDYALSNLKKSLDKINNLGIAGCIGVNQKGDLTGFIKDRDILIGYPNDKPQEVGTLDECLLIVNRQTFLENGGFDEALGSWHCYGVDFSMRMHKLGKRICVLPVPIWHNSPATNISNLISVQKKVMKKYNLKAIHTTAGTISRSGLFYSWLRYYLPKSFKNVIISGLGIIGVSSENDQLSRLLSKVIELDEAFLTIHIVQVSNVDELNSMQIKTCRVINNIQWPELQINHLFVKKDDIMSNVWLDDYRIIIIKADNLYDVNLFAKHLKEFKCIKRFEKHSIFVKEKA